MGKRLSETRRHAAFLAGLLLAVAMSRPVAALPPVQPPPQARLWGQVELADRWGRTDVKWRAMAERHAAQRAELAAGRLPRGVSAAAVGRWRRTLAAHERIRITDAALLAGIDAAVDRLPYRSDREGHGQGDLWLTPLEFLEAGGDCEDYAITKYFLLRELGVPAEALRLVVVRDRVRGLEHAVLLARPGQGQGDWQMLDNLRRGPVAAAATAAYQPLYAIGETGGFFYLPGGRS
ncbi:transglutaminase-like cysteine peptidase [Geminicoccaceae bacterium 1502E]|nr:transglutaminase-like cysteine peptidase [Geminicoccaceae bacterium 1502E]